VDPRDLRDRVQLSGRATRRRADPGPDLRRPHPGPPGPGDRGVRRRRTRARRALVILGLLLGCPSSSGPPTIEPPPSSAPTTFVSASLRTLLSVPPPPPNVLIVVAYNLGDDNLGVYGVHPLSSRQPTLEALAAEGVRFTHMWGTPACSPARAQPLSG